MRACFDNECYGWLHEDRSFEAIAMPKEWTSPDPRGRQIEDSRRRKGFHTPPLYIRDAHYPSQTEIDDVQAAYLSRRKSA